MKKSLTVFSLVLFLMVLGSSAQAVTWSFDFESLDETMDTWGPESPPVATDAVEYDYEWDLTEVEIRLEGGDLPPGAFVWSSIISILPAEVDSGFGTKTSVPFQLSPIVIDELDVLGISAYLWLGVSDLGMATGALNNITFGTIDTGPTYTITGVRVSGDFTVNPVPEPTSIALLSLGVLAVLRNRRSRNIQ